MLRHQNSLSSQAQATQPSEGRDAYVARIFPIRARGIRSRREVEERGWIRSKWGVSENNRRARFYAITRSGEKRLAAETENWARITAMVGRVLADGGAGS